MHILLITRHFPPEISGGARRPGLYTQALRALGHRVTPVTPFDGDDSDSITVRNAAIDRGMERLHSETPVAGAADPLSQLKARLRIWAYWPDDNIRWARDVVRTVKKSGLKPDWIMTTSPPESIHVIGRDLSRHMKTPWLAELRDTWVEAPHRKILAESHLRAAVERRIARHLLQSADAVTSVSEAVMSEAGKYVRPGTPGIIITHFSDPPPPAHVFDASKLNLVHTGGFSLSDRRRALGPLLEELAEIHARRPELVFHIAGPLTPEEIAMTEQASIPVAWHGSVTLAQSRALQAGADGLVLYSPPGSHALPGKYAEYAATGRPVFYFGNGDWLSLVEDASLLRPLKTGAMKMHKNESASAATNLSHLEAAKRLVSFMNTTARG